MRLPHSLSREYPPITITEIRSFEAEEDRHGMECPHCGSDFEATPHMFALGIDQDGTWQVSNARCPTCDRLIVSICSKEGKNYPAYPAGVVKARLSEDVPADLASEYWAASQVLPFSEEASAPMSRRLLQRILATKAGAGYGGLAGQIQRAIASPAMPPYLKEALDTLANVAKLETDQPKSFRSDALVPVYEGEAEWLLEILKPLFDFYYVQPARVGRKRHAVEERLAPPAAAVEPAELEEAEGAAEDWSTLEEAAAVEPAPAKQPVR
jgi:hypothetical protein